MAFASHAALHEGLLRDIAEAFARRGDDGKWSKA